MSAFARGRKSRDDHVRLKTPNVPDDVRKDRVVSPNRQSLSRIFRIAEIDRPGEELLAAVDAPRVEQLLRAQNAEQITLFVANEILSAVPSGHRQVRRAIEAL